MQGMLKFEFHEHVNERDKVSFKRQEFVLFS